MDQGEMAKITRINKTPFFLKPDNVFLVVLPSMDGWT